MVWEIVAREDNFEGHESAYVAVRPEHFAFNTTFVRLACVRPDDRVTVHVDSENRRIGFEFHQEKTQGSYALASQNAKGKRGSSSGMFCSSRGVFLKFPWAQSVTKLAPKSRRFPVRQEGKLWVIQLCPAFEEQRARESADIPSAASGVYRYVRESGEIVYIGRGQIKGRLAEPQRVDWDFDRVEYSLVTNPDDQVKWETFWLDKFKQENKGKLPMYNKVSGAATTTEGKAD